MKGFWKIITIVMFVQSVFGTSEVSPGFAGRKKYQQKPLKIKKVLGVDSRIQVHNPNNSFLKIGYILSSIGSCTGALIGRRHVLTAGHCVHSGRDGWAKNLMFYPGLSKNGYKGVSTSRKIISSEGWTKSKRREYDYALIILEKPLGDDVGWFGFGYDHTGFTSKLLNVVGYPADKDRSTMWRDDCTVVAATSKTFSHNCDTYGGMSGSPMYQYNSSTNSRTIYGVHTSAGSDYYNFNIGKRIDSITFALLKKWIAENP